MRLAGNGFRLDLRWIILNDKHDLRSRSEINKSMARVETLVTCHANDIRRGLDRARYRSIITSNCMGLFSVCSFLTRRARDWIYNGLSVVQSSFRSRTIRGIRLRRRVFSSFQPRAGIFLPLVTVGSFSIKNIASAGLSRIYFTSNSFVFFLLYVTWILEIQSKYEYRWEVICFEAK